MKHKIYDCFLYSDEKILLDIRFNMLDKHVEKFIIIESKFDHQGNKKKINFNINKHSKFKKKIKHLIIENFPKNFSNWERENFQRNYISKALNEVDNEDYVMISDVDEIPNLSKIEKIYNYKYSVFEQKLFYYKFNLHNKTQPLWHGSRICKKKYLKSPQWLRNQKVKKYPFWRIDKIKWNIIKNGGWHFSFLMTPEKIKKKINSWAHGEFNNNRYNTLNNIKKKLKSKKDLFDREIVLKKTNFDKSFPRYLRENFSKYKSWIL
jgi:beta-1,4-mannosyl-glycoprotein beta-1,4-N-acetylglucosaminyltransferase